MNSTGEPVWHELGDGERYVVGDAVEVLRTFQDEAAAVFLDDAWARPQRREQSGLAYDLHPFDERQAVGDESVDIERTTTEIIDACHAALVDGGWLVADADDWLTPRFVDYLRREWGDAAAEPTNGGFRRLGGVTYLCADGTPETDTHGAALSTGGYTVIFAHKGETARRTTVSARQPASWPTETYGRGGRAKPVEPYEAWVRGLVEPGELILIPCAGTAPAALAARRVFGDDARYVCVDTDERAFEAFRTRYDEIVTE